MRCFVIELRSQDQFPPMGAVHHVPAAGFVCSGTPHGGIWGRGVSPWCFSSNAQFISWKSLCSDFSQRGGRCLRHRTFRIVGATSQNMRFICCLYVVHMEGTSCDFKQTLETCCVLRWSNKYLFFQDLKKAQA